MGSKHRHCPPCAGVGPVTGAGESSREKKQLLALWLHMLGVITPSLLNNDTFIYLYIYITYMICDCEYNVGDSELNYQ